MKKALSIVCPECGFWRIVGDKELAEDKLEEDTCTNCGKAEWEFEAHLKKDRNPRDQVKWEQPRAIDSVPNGHPDKYAASPYEAAKIMEKHGLWTHPSDDSGTPVPVGITPMDCAPATETTFDLPADIARRQGRPPVKGHKTLSEVIKNLGIE